MPKHPVTNFLSLFSVLKDDAEDRTVAICCAAYLEDVLELAIVTKLPGASPKLCTKLMEDGGPLQSAGAKIDIARALNLIDDDDRVIFIMIARVRNRFAHNIRVATFEHPEVAPLLGKVQLAGENKRYYDILYPPRTIQTQRQRFMCLAMMVGMRVSNYVNSVYGTGKITRIVTDA